MIHKVVSLGCMICASIFCSAQTSIVSTPYIGTYIPPVSLAEITITNAGSETQVVISAWISNSAGEKVLEIQSAPFVLPVGQCRLSKGQLVLNRVEYASSPQGQYLRSTSSLPSGIYNYCVFLHGAGEVIDEYCTDIEGSLNNFMLLTYPMDGDTVQTTHPILNWQHSEPFNILGKGESYEIIVSELGEGESVFEAIASGSPVFRKNNIRTHSIPYPPDAVSLKKGKTYTWQVRKLSAGVIIDETDIWVFHIDQPKERTSTKYVELKNKRGGGIHSVYDNMLYFTFEERYSRHELSYKIFDDSRKEVQFTLRADQKENGSTISSEPGMNRYSIDLSGYNLDRGFYELEVRNGKQEKLYLKFYVAK